VRKDDEWWWKGWFLLVLHDDSETVKFPDLMGENVRPEEDGIENGDE